MSEDIEKQLVEKLKTRNFSVQMDESTLRDSEAVLITYEKLVAKNILPVLNEILHAVIKCVNTIKYSAKCERLFKLFCEEQNEDHVRLLLHPEVRWLSKGNCLKRFMQLFEAISVFLSERLEMKYLLTIDGKAFPILVELSDISNMQYQEQLAELQNDESVKTLFNIKGAMAWLCEGTEIKYPNATQCARKL
ncbi:SCAN domain-containing protein 3, partial [Nephila pilipes]